MRFRPTLLFGAVLVVVAMAASSHTSVQAEPARGDLRKETIRTLHLYQEPDARPRCDLTARIMWFGQVAGPGTVTGLAQAICTQDMISMSAEATVDHNAVTAGTGPVRECELARDTRCRNVRSVLPLDCSPCTGAWETDAVFTIEFPAALLLLSLPEGCQFGGPNSVICELNSGLIEVV